jgi:hypothetical protein
MISISAAWLSPPPPGNVNALTGVAMLAAANTVAAMTSFRIALSVLRKPLPSIERANPALRFRDGSSPSGLCCASGVTAAVRTELAQCEAPQGGVYVTEAVIYFYADAPPIRG